MGQVFQSGILSTARRTIGHGPLAVVIYDVSHYVYECMHSKGCLLNGFGNSEC